MENLTTKQNLEGVLNHAQANINNSFSTIYSKDDVLNILKFIANNTEDKVGGEVKEWFMDEGMEKIKNMIREAVTDAVDNVTFAEHCSMDGYDNGGEYRVSIEVDEMDIQDAIMNNLDLDNFEEKLLSELPTEEEEEEAQS